MMCMTGNKLVDRILLALSLLSSLFFLGFVVYRGFIYQKPLPDDLSEFKKMQAESRKMIFAESFKLPPLTVILPSRTKKLRFLDLVMYLVPFEGPSVETLERYKPQISDIVIDVASNMEPSELNTSTGKILLENRIKTKVNNLVGNSVVKEILFSKFVIQ